MTTVVIVIHLMVVLAMIGLILLQRSEGGALGIGGGQGAFLTGRSAGNVLTRTTAGLAIAFFLTSLGLALIGKYQSRPADILERIPGQTTPVTSEAPAPPIEGGAPTNAEELFKQFGSGADSSGGPQTPPAGSDASGGAAAPAAPTPSEAPATQQTTPANELPAPANELPVPTTELPTPAPLTPPASGNGTQ